MGGLADDHERVDRLENRTLLAQGFPDTGQETAVFGQAFQDNGTRVTRNAAGAITAINDLDDRTHTLWGVGVAYNLAPGLILYSYYNNINDENVPNVTPSDGRYTAGTGTGSTPCCVRTRP